jgi:hypothetical protein
MDDQDVESSPLSRRSMLKGVGVAAAAGTGLVLAATPAGATPDANPPLLGESTNSKQAGVTGENTATSGAVGVFGVASAKGSGANTGVSGWTSGSGGAGVSGSNKATTGNAVGVYGNTASPNGFGVYGINPAKTGTGTGVAGYSTSPDGTGVRGGTTATTGDKAYGVWGTTDSTEGIGVLGEALTTTASATAKGVWGKANSPDSVAVAASNSSTTGNAYGLVAEVPASNTAGFGIVCSGNFAASGAKSAAVPFPDGTRHLMYCVESPESWFEDFGRSDMIAGEARVEIERDFATTVLTDEDYFVFLTPEGECAGLYVSARDEHGFTVRELQGGRSDLRFSYRIVAKRKDVKAPRLAEVAWPSLGT